MPRTLRPDQRAQVWIFDLASGTTSLVLERDDVLLEAPNWSLDGDALYVNGDGLLWRLDLASGALERVPFEGLPPINNDHVLAPDGRTVFLSADDFHIYRGSIAGGAVARVTPEDGDAHFLHGVSPDGATLAYVAIEDGDFANPGRLALLDTGGRGPTRILETSDRHLDGPEFSPDGRWLLFNTEAFTEAPGHAQLARVPVEGGEVERLRASETVDWFPHLSPDGRHGVHLVFPPGTQGHPADHDVRLRVVDADDWSTELAGIDLFGGQGTINVPSWSPDSRRFAYCAYPLEQR
ncbi:biopolymer transporter Tol [Amnibacterium sp. CER49]|uniref:TolB family protein n=1 Tax=Amnibacterium sp. CER49 TaxID=3039161 RepID=UPI00244C3637|nr:biopolymer transporter Tol [Amnibacterium sp. CER49]MDH2444809.1 biopolymer transporter Tol [Amnibacterium sp. CER49]